MLVKLATRATHTQGKKGTRHQKKRKQKRKEKQKNGEKENGKRQENWLQKMLMIYLIDLTMNICKDVFSV